ncbi:MAG: hypothetical protein R3F20_13425 [Planctomycetota bacterium]
MNVGLFVLGVTLVVGTFWCKSVFARVPDHVEELLNGGSAGRKAGILLAWLVTLPVFFYTAGTYWSLFRVVAPGAASGPC